MKVYRDINNGISDSFSYIKYKDKKWIDAERVEDLQSNLALFQARYHEALEEIKALEQKLAEAEKMRDFSFKKRVELEGKVEIAVEALEDAKRTLKWYRETFQGPEHEFEHYWRVELPHVIDEALTKLKE